MKKFRNIIVALALVVALASFTACNGVKEDVLLETTTKVYSGDVLYVGNTASVSGGHETIGKPFNVGINAAFAAWNATRGDKFTVALKTYDDAGNASNSVTLTEKLIYEDDVFAIVGNYGSTQVAQNLDVIKEAQVPMVYAAAGNSVLLNEDADTWSERCIFPVQPLSNTEGRMLYARAVAPEAIDPATFAMTGGLGGTKVGVISDSSEASIQMTEGVKAQAGKKAEVSYQSSATAGDFSAAATAIKNAGCDVVIVTVVGAQFTAALKALVNAGVTGKVITTYNNSSATVFNGANTLMLDEYVAVFGALTIYAQGWLDISSLTYVYDADADGVVESGSFLAYTYKALYESMSLPYTGVAGFNEEYWAVAEDLFDYCMANGMVNDALVMSSNSFALAGYIAGNMFCQGLDKLEAAGKTLTRQNYIEVMENNEFKVSMGGMIDYKDGIRAGVQQFSLSSIFDAYTINGGLYHSAAAATVQPLTSLSAFLNK